MKKFECHGMHSFTDIRRRELVEKGHDVRDHAINKKVHLDFIMDDSRFVRIDGKDI